MDYTPKLTKKELIVVKEALLHFTWLNEDGMDAFEYPKDREVALTLYNKLNEAYILERE